MRFRTWIPNAISLSRLPLTLLAVDAALNQNWYDGFVWLSCAVVTDMIDGTVARLLNARSEWGTIYIDPYSDGFMGFVAMLGLALQPDGRFWAAYLPTALVIAVALKRSKHADDNLWRQRISRAALPLCYTSTIIILMMAYAIKIGGDTSWVYLTTFTIVPMMAYLKRRRIMDWWAGRF